MIEKRIITDLAYREINREGDIDYFIETQSYPINFEVGIEGMSRIQFPMSRAILVRTTKVSSWVTIHIMRDVDLYSSFANFELNLEGHELFIKQEEGYIVLKVQSQGGLS